MKKTLVGGLILALLFAPLLWGVKRAEAAAIELKMAHFMSPMHIQHQRSFVPFAKKVEELTGGKVKIRIYPGGALGGPKQLPDAVKAGITDIAFIIPGYSTGRFPRISAFDLPFLFDSAEHTTAVIYELYDRYLAPDFKDYKVLCFYSCGPGQLMTVTRPIRTLEDVKGLKMRAPSAYMTKTLKLFGANPVGMPISKLHMSLEKRVIDGMLTPFSAVTDFKLFDLVKYIAEANVYTMPMAVVMNKEKFQSLPEYAKKAIEEATGRQWGIHAARVYDEHDANTVRKINELGKIKIYKIPKAELKRFKERVAGLEHEWIKEMSARGIPAKELMEALKHAAEKTR